MLHAGTVIVTSQSQLDVWIGRLSIIVGTLIGIGLLWHRARLSLHRMLSEVVDLRVQQVETALALHTDAEATLVRTQIDQALAPIRDSQNRMLGRMDAFTSEHDNNDRRHDDELDQIRIRVHDLEVKTA